LRVKVGFIGEKRAWGLYSDPTVPWGLMVPVLIEMASNIDNYK